MTDNTHAGPWRTLKHRPLQAGKFIGILLSLGLGVAGFFRFIDPRTLTDNPLLGDGQSLSLLLIPLISLGLVRLVFIETVVTAYRVVRSDESLSDQVDD